MRSRWPIALAFVIGVALGAGGVALLGRGGGGGREDHGPASRPSSGEDGKGKGGMGGMPGMGGMGGMRGMDEGDATIRIDPVTLQSAGVRFVEVTRGPLRRTIETVGYVQYNEPRTAHVSPRIAGWIERIHADVTGQQVHAGEPLFELFSRELYSAQAEYLVALESARKTPDARGVETLVKEGRRRLELFGIAAQDIAQVEQSGEPQRALVIRAPIDGIVTEKEGLLGSHVEAGARQYTISDISTVWVFAEVYEQDVPFLSVGQEARVRLAYQPGRRFMGRVTYVYPFVDPKTRTVRVRMEFHNPGYFLKPGMYADVAIERVMEHEAVLVPEAAVVRSGERATVFVSLGAGRFEPRQVELGLRGDEGALQVRAGLSGGEVIARTGQFLLDSETQLREAAMRMTPPEGAPGKKEGQGMPGMQDHQGMPGMQDRQETQDGQGMPGMQDQETRDGEATQGARPEPGRDGEEQPARPTAADERVLAYVCPMPTHASIRYDGPGECPICHMQLVPLTASQAEALEDQQPEGAPTHWTCPMPEHRDVREPGPGNCPRCGMTLIPAQDAAPPEPAPPPAGGDAPQEPATPPADQPQHQGH